MRKSNPPKIYFRYADIDDSELVFHWQCIPRSRRYFNNPDPPDRETHGRWFRETLADPFRRLLIICDFEEPIGVLRMDRGGQDADCRISILIAPHRYGWGYGRAALKLARRIWPHNIFTADVKPDNGRSLALFTGEGYRFQDGTYCQPAVADDSVVAFCPDGGAGVGLGHVSRCIGLAEAVKSNGHTPVFLVPRDRDVISRLWDYGYPLCAFDSNPACLWDAVSDASAIIVDHYRIPLDELSRYNNDNAAMDNRRKLLVVFDDTCERSLPVDIVINGADRIGGNKLPYPVNSQTTFLLGPKYQIIRPDLRLPSSESPRTNGLNILVTMGGGDYSNLNTRLLNFFRREICIPFKDRIRIDFIIGPFASVPDIELPSNILCHHNPPSLSELMKNADIAVSGGGQTLLELLYFNLPVLALCLSDNQEKNLMALSQSGYINYVARVRQGAAWLDSLKRTLVDMLTSESARNALVERSRNLIDGKGNQRISAVIDDHLFRIREREDR